MKRRLPDYSSWQNEAAVVACTLRAAGIPATVADWHFISVKPALEFGYNRPRVLIPPACRDEAIAYLNALEPISSEPLYPCPDCGRETRRIRRILAMLVITWLGSFHPFFLRRRRCGHCRKTFRPDPPASFTAEELGYEAEQPGLLARLKRLRQAGLYRQDAEA
ncbi:hypothetical protein [Maricaulis sp.]|uniref:hypothetical protein n=1 Tax=Maricaulis sp. TaxID=1486257 RepID=UPI0025BFF085|nr:hypothetical protein [Maricaulis sp.]